MKALRVILGGSALALAMALGFQAVRTADWDGPPREPRVRVLYQYVGDDGRVRLVESEDQVPADKRDRMGRVEVPVEPVRQISAKAPAERREPRVVVYTTSWCGYCKRMLRDLDRMDVRYTNRDIERESGAREDLARLVGGSGVPVTVVDGKIVRGYDPERVEKLIDRSRSG